MNSETIYEKIREKRKNLGITQSELAEKMGYADKSMIAKIEKGIIDLPQSKIIAFAEILETTPSYLMGLTNMSLDTYEINLIKIISSLSETGKEKLFIYAKDMLKLHPKEQ